MARNKLFVVQTINFFLKEVHTMSTSLLYHAFNIKGVKYRATSYLGNTLILRTEMTERSFACANCQCEHVSFKGKKIRKFHMPPIGRKHSILELEFHRLRCKNCGHLWWPQLPFMLGTKRYTRSFALTVLDLLKFGTIRAVAGYLQVGWDLVKDIHKARLLKLYQKPRLANLVYLGIDEFSVRKGHSYMTIFVNLASGRILHAVKGRSAEDIEPFLKKIARKATGLKAVAIDMSTSYCKAVTEHLGDVDIVFDHYHISAMINRAIDDLRRDQQNKMDEEHKKTLKGSRFLLLRNYSSLDEENQRKLQTLLEVNKPLFVMYSMKEQFRGFWKLENPKAAQDFLYQWCFDALTSGTRQLIKIGLTLNKYRNEILNYFKHWITNAVTEGLNNKIKTLKRQAYGFRDMEYFKLRLYHLHTQRYSLSG